MAPRAWHLMTASRRHSACQANCGVGQAGVQLAQAAALAQHQLADAPLLALREAGRVDIGHQVGAVAVVVVVRHHLPDLVQVAGPAQLALALVERVVAVGHRLRTAVCASVRTRSAWSVSTTKRACSSRTDSSRTSSGCGMAQRVQALAQVDDHALAQRAARRQQRCRCRSAWPACTGWPARRRSTARRSSRSAGQQQLVGVAGLRCSRRCTSAGRRGVMRPSVTPLAASSCDTAPTVPDEPSASCQCCGAKGCSASSSSAPAAICAARKALLGEAAVGEEAHRQADAADLERFGQQRHAALAEDHLGGAPADVDHQARRVGGLQVRHAGVDQPRFLAPGDHLDRVAQRLLRAQQEGVAVARLAQRLRGHRAHLARREAGQPRGEAAQAVQAALHGGFGEHAVGVEPAAQAHGLLQVVDAAVAAMLQLRRSRAGSCSSPCRWRPVGRRGRVRGCACPDCA